MLRVSHAFNAQQYRRKAAMCESYAAHAQSVDDREQLLRMRDGCLARAEKEDWLGGLPPPPPAQALALRLPA
ncbi:MAG: hypothetical protein JO000_27930 [Alphaproteobacteria bacterium]|nr:hypothetical protein [Alphaproteobacteria bacterium]